MIAPAPAFADEVLALFSQRGAERVELGILQPADPFLDIAGEDLRRRIFLTESETGESLCLRPEFTIPVCLGHIASRAATPRRYAYLGEVFRQRREGGSEFFQAGIEDLGEIDRETADARSLADAEALLAALLPRVERDLMIGDQAVFAAVLAALGLPRGWQKRLLRAFGAPEMLAGALADLAAPPAFGAQLPKPIAGLAARGDAGALAAFIAEEMQTAGLSPGAGRSPQEIAGRLIEKAELRSVRLADSAIEALRGFLAIRTSLDAAPGALAEFADRSGLVLDEALERFTARAERIADAGLAAAEIRYDAAFGRPLDYYTGLVFEIRRRGAAVPLAGGGRYDRLLTLLGARDPIPGVGFSVWLDRVAELREERP